MRVVPGTQARPALVSAAVCQGDSVAFVHGQAGPGEQRDQLATAAGVRLAVEGGADQEQRTIHPGGLPPGPQPVPVAELQGQSERGQHLCVEPERAFEVGGAEVDVGEHEMASVADRRWR